MSITTEQITDIIAAEIDDAELEVSGGDGKYQIKVVADIFAGLNSVKRQQTIYRIINEHISSGAIHAVSMLLHTKEEHAKAK
ncbi:MAG: BolA/IbaG family iron-sulfur metabolism protein [Gammaproteobacteria bacterium]|jgi:acid stress-induced BolA-like protein IbaG/YrbA|nr:BolA/IbaG family iron-sulfur metabolism protein [Gammaproteobacteria bacterium]